MSTTFPSEVKTTSGKDFGDITEANAKKQASYTNFTFEADYWDIDEDSSYPYLSFFPEPTSVDTGTSSNITDASFTITGSITTEGTITERGFVYAETANPTTSNNKLIVSGTSASYQGTITNLEKDTLYYTRAYAIIDSTTYYGDDVEVTTLLPNVETGSASAVIDTAFTISGSVTTGHTVTERGFVYGTSPNPVISGDYVTVSGTTGNMSARITNLSLETLYYVRAYAIVDLDTYYGDDVEVTTLIRQGTLLEILEYQSTEVAEVGTDASSIIITGHGLNAGDFIVNATIRDTGAERGSRLVGSVGFDEDTIPLENSMTGQTDGDDIRLYKFIDRTPLVKVRSFRMLRRSAGASEASFTLVTTASYLPQPGQYVRINWNLSSSSYKQFLGVISTRRIQASTEAGDDTLLVEYTCVGLNQVPARRTIRIYYEADGALTYGDIVQDMVDQYLFQEGIRASIINDGEILQDDWIQDVVSISEVLDECASKSGFQWFIDNDALLHFYDEPTSVDDAVENIEDGGTFTDYRNIVVEDSIDNYINKLFIAGGRDTLYDNDIIIGSEDFDESLAMQDICAGTGVYGNVHRDAGLVESDYFEAESGTTTTNIKITGHAQEVGYMIWNATRSEYRQITAVVDDDNFTVDAVTGQTDGDDIALFAQANKLIANEFKVRGQMPRTFSFETRELRFEPASKLLVDLALYGIDQEYYVIEDVEIVDNGGTLNHMFCRVTCRLRDNNKFSIKRMPNYLNYFGGF
jgi:hypothetical protein